MDQLPHLQQLLRQLQQVPYLASKNLYRVAHYFLEMEPRRFEQFMGVLTEAHKQLAKCEICFAWKEREQACIWCSAPKRNQGIICVVETWHDLCAIEKTGAFSGVYHVLGGAICPLEGRGPEDLTIEPLVERIKNGRPETSGTGALGTGTPCTASAGTGTSGTEIILALNQTPEGEATAAYIARRLESISHQSVLSCLSRGLPVGSSLEMMDRLTIFKALAERRSF